MRSVPELIRDYRCYVDCCGTEEIEAHERHQWLVSWFKDLLATSSLADDAVAEYASQWIETFQQTHRGPFLTDIRAMEAYFPVRHQTINACSRKRGPKPGGWKQSAFESEAMQLYRNGAAPREIDAKMLQRNGAFRWLRGKKEYWKEGTFNLVRKAHEKRTLQATLSSSTIKTISGNS